jgi:hypothetical protein
MARSARARSECLPSPPPFRLIAGWLAGRLAARSCLSCEFVLVAALRSLYARPPLDAHALAKATRALRYVVTAEMVDEKTKDLLANVDMSKFVL